MPTEKYGVGSPFHAGAGGGGGGGGGSGAATQLFEGPSKTVPQPHSAAWALPGIINGSDVSGVRMAAAIAIWKILPGIIRPPSDIPDLGLIAS
jgi:hypothetical protein